ncbi:MAG: 3-phosphoshikimate 1-carboxyvinyltransferase [Peptococcaceae bacterium]|nr:3-phosphoshikimate 1-carboxyvinyltransferase [Peptococcaceae bacterium]
MDLHINSSGKLKGEIRIPGDKSISHRAVMLGAIASGDTVIENFLAGADCLATIACMSKMGITIDSAAADGCIRVAGKGLDGLREPEDLLDAGNSGTTMRLLLGILAGQKFFSVITGDASLRQRPMARVTQPLINMGAQIRGRRDAGLAPLSVWGGDLFPVDFVSPVASAQVKSAVLLAGLYAHGKTSVTEEIQSRDHTERMLEYFGANLSRNGGTTTLEGRPNLCGRNIEVPGDISSAAFFLVAGAIVPNSDLVLRGVGINPTRSGILDVLLEMGADIELLNKWEAAGEPVADLRVRYAGPLKGVTVDGGIIPRLIDEIPVLAVAGAVAEGEMVIKDAAELKVKESNRIATVVDLLNQFGANAEELPDGLIVRRTGKLRNTACDSYGDHRIAMAAVVAALAAEGTSTVRDASCIDVSFPGFEQVIDRISV